jgi:ABC-type transport system involved in multi-copper enzyme maturation permease subunit
VKKIILKELREGAKVALLALAVLIFLLTVIYRQYGADLQEMNLAGSPLGQAMAQAGYFCAIFGTVLGWLQIRAEKHRDLWAFLVHRPMTRTAILVSKIVAGLCLYTLGAGLPLLGFVILVWTPGHVATPFEWGMTLPVAAMFLLGIVFISPGCSLLCGKRAGMAAAAWDLVWPLLPPWESFYRMSFGRRY